MVMRVDVLRSTVVVSHDPIPGLMGAMMMPFPVRDPRELEDLVAGTNIEFTLVVDKAAAYATAIRVRPYESVEQDPVTTRRLSLLKRLANPEPAARAVAPGELVPD